MTIKTTQFNTAREAVNHAIGSGEDQKAILWDGFRTAASKDVDRLVDAGVAFAFLCEREGRILTIPVN